MKVHFFAILRQVVGQKEVEFEIPERATVQDLLNEILHRYPALKTELLDLDGQIYPHVHIFVNGRDAPFLENAMNTELRKEDVIGIFPAVGGG